MIEAGEKIVQRNTKKKEEKKLRQQMEIGDENSKNEEKASSARCSH